MELTVLTKKRYDELLAQIKLLNDAVAFTQNEIAGIKNLETQVALAHSQLRAIQDSNNQLAEIAFDEARFTDVVMEKVDELAREAARDEIDADQIARDAASYVELPELVDEDKVEYLIERYVSRYSLVSESEAEDLISDYVENNCDYVEKDVTDTLHDEIQELKEELRALKDDLVVEILQLIANKLTGKDTHHANNNRDHGLYISGTLNNSEATSHGEARA